ncbi:MAG: O-sialoglycoprotein endopeptidase [Clostridiales bacterium]|nr:O-sialoglycoprotein endopeptidase [Clostridiales bacterium]
MNAILGFDTSCYTTSAALATLEGEILCSSRRLLTVPAGERGLMQSEGLFQHVSRLPEILEVALREAAGAEIVAVAASVRPRPREDSYMPVFRAGESQARSAAALLGVPFYPVSHQEGHVRAALVDSGIDRKQPFLALHLSGGTTEMLLSDGSGLTLLGGSLDLSAGQLIDRIGVFLNLGFPAGPEMERLALRGTAEGRIGVSIRGCNCCIAGAENKAKGFLASGGLTPEDAAAEVFDFLARTVERMIEAGCGETGCRQALLAGGVASSRLFGFLVRARAEKRRLRCRICFARPELSGDNAAGVALLGADRWWAEQEVLHGHSD